MTAKRQRWICPFCLEECIEGTGWAEGVWVHDDDISPMDENMHTPVREAMGVPTACTLSDEFTNYIMPWEV